MSTPQVGDIVIILYKTMSLTGWPIFAEFEITELRGGGYIGVRTTPRILQPPDCGLNLTGITEPISNSQIIPLWLKDAVIHSWNAFYGENKKEMTDIIYCVGNFIKRRLPTKNGQAWTGS